MIGQKEVSMDSEKVCEVEITQGSSNVFADLGLPNPEERLLKAQIALQIDRFISEKEWTQAQTAKAVGLTQPEVSHLLRGRLAGFSAGRLLTILNRLGHTVEVHISAEERAPEDAQLLVCIA